MTTPASDKNAKFNGWTQAKQQTSYSAAQQLAYIPADLKKYVGGTWWKYWPAMFSAGFLAVLIYRVERALFLQFGRGYVVVRSLLAPVRMILRPLRSNCDLQYTAQIGGEFQVQHPQMGLTVSGRSTIGDRVIMAGGNTLASRHRGSSHGDLVIGDDVTIGMNAIIFGPVRVGDNAIVGAGAIVTRDVAEGDRVAGAPARSTRKPPPD